MFIETPPEINTPTLLEYSALNMENENRTSRLGS